METIQLFIHENIYWIKLGSIPFVSGFIGWFTNWQAIKMTFAPLEFFGIRIGRLKIGWQGIIPSNSAKVARIGVDLMTEKLLRVEEIFSRLDTKAIAGEIQPQMMLMLKNVVNNVMQEKAPTIWNRIPDNLKKTLYARIAADIPQTIEQLLEDIKLNHEKLLDFKKFYITSILRDKRLLNELFIKCGKAEFKFIEHSGWWFGLLFGFFQMLAWHYFPVDWTLPVAGIIVGYATNWLALKLIFKPEEKVRILFWEFQGLFIKRQMEVAEEYSAVVTQKILTAENIWEFMLNENNGKALYELMEKHVAIAMDNLTGTNVNTIALTLAPVQYERIRKGIIKEYTFRLTQNLKSMYGALDRSLDLKNLIRDRMQQMSPKDFVGVLRPAFEEEEWILILVGAVLGGLAGAVQWALVFGGLM